MNDKVAVILGLTVDINHTVKLAANMGLLVYIFGRNTDLDYLDIGLYENVKIFNIDIKNSEDIICLLEGLNLITLPTPIGRYLTTLGRINDYFELIGVSFDSALKCTDKLLFNNILERENLRKARTTLLLKSDLTNNCFRDFPYVVKPRYGSGSKGINFVYNINQLNDVFNLLDINDEYIIEKKFIGKEYGIDGLVLNGELIFLNIREKFFSHSDPLIVVGYVTLNVSKNNKINEFIKPILVNVLSLLGIQSSIFHADVVYEQNLFEIIEISARPSGHFLHDRFLPLATGIDISSVYLNYLLQIEQKIEVIYKPHLGIFYLDFNRIKSSNRVEYLKQYFGGMLLDFKINPMLTEEKIQSQRQLVSGGYIILVGNNQNELLEAVRPFIP